MKKEYIFLIALLVAGIFVFTLFISGGMKRLDNYSVECSKPQVYAFSLFATFPKAGSRAKMETATDSQNIIFNAANDGELSFGQNGAIYFVNFTENYVKIMDNTNRIRIMTCAFDKFQM